MFCTDKERQTCDVEKRGCEGCYYENETPEKKIERLEIVKDMLDGELKLLRDELQQEKEKNKKLEEEKAAYVKGYIIASDEYVETTIKKIKQKDFYEKVIDLMAEELLQDGIFVNSNVKDVEEYYFKKARGEE